MPVRIAIERPIKRIAVAVEIRLAVLPGAGSGVNHAVPTHIEQVFAHIVPRSVQHPHRAVFLPVADEITDILHVRQVIRENAPAVESRRRDERGEVFVGIRLQERLVAIPGQVVPRDGDHVRRQQIEFLGMFDGDLSPKQQLFILQRGQCGHLFQMSQVNVGVRRPGHRLFAFAASEFERLVATDMNELGREHRHDLAQVVADKIVRPRFGRTQYLAAALFAEVGVTLLPQHIVQVPEGLLLRDDLDMVTCGVIDQFGDLLRGDRAAVRVDRRMRLRLV